MAVPIYRSDQALIYVEVLGVPIDHEPWSELSGGDNVAESAQAFPGGMRPLIALGGFPKPSPLIVTRPWTDVLINAYKALWGKTGLAQGNVTYQVLNANKEPVDVPFSYTGVLANVARPAYKAGTTEEAKLSLTFDLNGEIA